ncbi:lipopolysaccharide-modifying protein [Chytriomyces sp. MP71]|nr:lipopolysaccharide-modifying protein [Chytriomyces sp. MP71]
MVDVGFHATYQCSTAVCQELKQRYPLKEKVSLEKTLEFKYLLVVDGNTWPNRIQQYIETNSVVLYNGIFEDWFLGQLKPWVHYIPVRVDLADLEEKLEWLQAHDEEAKRISKNARMFARGYNDIAQIKCYLGLLFVEYARLYDA